MLHFVGDKLANRPRKKPLVNSVYAASLPLILTPTFLSSRHHLFVFSFVCLLLPNIPLSLHCSHFDIEAL